VGLGAGVIRIELTLLDDAVVLCTLYGRDGRVLGHGRGRGNTAEEDARTEAAHDMARREAILDERIARELIPFKPRGATRARFMQDAARILGKVGR
jgi:hypothetical protein